MLLKVYLYARNLCFYDHRDIFLFNYSHVRIELIRSTDDWFMMWEVNLI